MNNASKPSGQIAKLIESKGSVIESIASLKIQLRRYTKLLKLIEEFEGTIETPARQPDERKATK